MDAPIDPKKKLVLPVALAVVALASGCGSTPAPTDAAQNDSAVVADAGADAGCIPPEVYDPSSMSCVPIV